MNPKEILYRVLAIQMAKMWISSAAKIDSMIQSPYKTSVKAWTPKLARNSYDSHNRKEIKPPPSTKAL